MSPAISARRLSDRSFVIFLMLSFGSSESESTSLSPFWTVAHGNVILSRLILQIFRFTNMSSATVFRALGMSMKLFCLFIVYLRMKFDLPVYSVKLALISLICSFLLKRKMRPRHTFPKVSNYVPSVFCLSRIK